MMKALLIAIGCSLPLCVNAISKCEINGSIVYQNSPCPSDAVEKPINNGTFSTTDTSEAARQARISTAIMQQDRLQREREYENARNNQAILDQQEQKQAYREELQQRANAKLDTSIPIGEMLQQKIDRQNAQRELDRLPP